MKGMAVRERSTGFPCKKTCSITELDHIADNDVEDPAVYRKEAQRREPQTGNKGRVAQEFELIALLQPKHLYLSIGCS